MKLCSLGRQLRQVHGREAVSQARPNSSWRSTTTVAAFLLLVFGLGAAPVQQVIRTNQPGRMVTKENDVQYIAAGQQPVIAPTNQWLNFRDALRTLELGRATVRLTDWKHVFLRDRSRLEIVPRSSSTSDPMLRLTDGELYLSRGGGEVSLPVEVAGTRGTPKGTEFLVSVVNGTATFTMFDGEVELANAATPEPVRVRAGEQGIAEPGQPIRVRPILEGKNIVQWWLYYPAVLDPDELYFAPAEQTQLAASLAAYRSGHLVRALQTYPGYPTPAAPPSDAQRTYLAALLLSVGAVDKASMHLSTLADTNIATAQALRLMIDVVQDTVRTRSTASHISQKITDAVERVPTRSEWIALSYANQSTNNLSAALAVARKATALLNAGGALLPSPSVPPGQSGSFTPLSTLNSPSSQISSNGFAWSRVAELEFSFGHTRAAREAVERSLSLSPSNAQAHCVHGFLLAASHRFDDALAAFDHAIELDPFLANAWLGRGLIKRRLGLLAPVRTRSSASHSSHDFTDAVERVPTDSWLSDLQTAAIVEPRRSLIRAYAGKAFSDAGRPDLALKELDYAAQLDPNDPTPTLYKALELYQQNRPNEAARELEHRIELNDNRAVYRSRLLLDQDHATRSASLAKIYQDAGLEDVALREAARAVSYDYTSHSAHQFLAESYNALRDPTRFNLRYETVWFNELLLANLLSPVGAGLLSQNISQQEYASLFEHNRLGLTTSTEYRSDGQLREIASHYGLVDRLSYTLDLDYQHNNGTRPNNDLDRIEWYSQFKYQLTDRDSVFLLTKYQDYESGDNFQHYDPNKASTKLRLEEFQTPLVAMAIHREWFPGIHTTLLGARLANEQTLDASQTVRNLITNVDPFAIFPLTFDELSYRSQFEIYQAELNQVFETENHTWVAGGRFQWGNFSTTDLLEQPAGGLYPPLNAIYPPVGTASVDEEFQRVSAYGYYTWTAFPRFRLTAGLAYDRVQYPANFRFSPISPGSSEKEKLSPKVALHWDMSSALTLRGIYSQFLGGVSLEESFRLEPTQLAGFSQAFRSVISETEAGSVAAPEYELGGLALDVKLGSGTFLGIEGHQLRSRVEQDIGLFYQNGFQAAYRTSARENLDYEERSVGISLHQLISDRWSAGASYRYSRSELDWFYPTLPASPENPSRIEGADFHRVHLQLLYNHQCGFFGRVESDWFIQDNSGYPNMVHPDLRSSESAFQANLFVGYRFWRRRGEVTLGCLNFTGQDYRLNSLTPFAELPHERVFLARARFNF